MRIQVHFTVKKKIAFRPYSVIGILFFAIVSASASGATEDIGSPSDMASVMFASVDSRYAENMIYVNAHHLMASVNILSLPTIKEKVINDGKSFFIDFSSIQNYKERDVAKTLLQKTFGIRFHADMVIIGLYKDELILTPLDPDEVQVFNVALSRNAEEQRKKHIVPAVHPRKAEGVTLPHVAFYLDVNYKISDKDCAFPVSPFWDRGTSSFCHKPNIALVYRVNLIRSLTHGTVGSATPDAKLVRISLDEESAGAGIELNSTLSHVTSEPEHGALNGWARSYTTSAIAKDYRFSISASNTKAAILKTFPASNLNASYQKTDISGFAVGVSGGAESAKETLEARYRYNQSRVLAYNTQDYRVERSATNAQHVTFIWARDHYSTAESLLSKKTGPMWDYGYPVSLNRIRPTSYQGFVPNFDVVFKAAPNASGLTTFTINSMVNIWPISTAAHSHYYLVGGHLSFQAQEQWQKTRRVGKEISFDVDWNHPVFTGGRPVNLQLGGLHHQCIGYGDKAEVQIRTCDLNRVDQSFIYDQYGRYQSAVDTGKCLDLTDLNEFKICNASLSQRWKWIKDSDLLQNEFQGHYLGHDLANKRLIPIRDNSENIDTRTLTKFTKLYGF